MRLLIRASSSGYGVAHDVRPTDLDMTTPVKTLVLGGAGEQEASEAARLKADAISTEAQEVEEWEDERGDSSTLGVAGSVCVLRNTRRTYGS